MIFRKGMTKEFVTISFSFFVSIHLFSQLKWNNVDSLYQPLPSSVHIYFTDQSIDTGSFRAYYLIADLKDKKLEFTADTTLNRRLTPSKFYERDDKPLVLVNCTFFSFETNGNLNVVIKDGTILSHNHKPTKGKVADSTKIYFPNTGTFGINKKGKADIVWVKSDSLSQNIYASQTPVPVTGNYVLIRDGKVVSSRKVDSYPVISNFYKWKMKTAVGGGPVLLQNGEIKITNNEEMMFAGKAINDKHPRTAMGYTKDHKLVILVIEGRSESSGGASLIQEAQILKDLDCWEALNLDGGGSSCMLVNGKETIKPSDKGGERAVPAVFIIKKK